MRRRPNMTKPNNTDFMSVVSVATAGSSIIASVYPQMEASTHDDNQLWSYTFDTNAPSSTIMFFSPEIISQDTLLPDDKAWKELEALFTKVDENPTLEPNMSYESLRELRSYDNHRLSRLYGSEDR